MTIKKPENNPDFDVLEFMRSLSPVHNEKYECATVAEWTACWLLHYCNELKDSTKLEYQKTIHQHINRVLGKVMLNELSHEDVQLFINSLNMGVGIENKLSPKSIKNIHGVLHSVFVSYEYSNIPIVDNVLLRFFHWSSPFREGALHSPTLFLSVKHQVCLQRRQHTNRRPSEHSS